MFFFFCNSWFLFNPWNLRETSSQEFFIAFAGLDLFAIVLNQLTRLYHFAILDLFAIHDLFASTAIPYPSQSLTFFAIIDLFVRASLPEFFIAFAPEQQIFTSSPSLSLRKNLPLCSPCFAILHSYLHNRWTLCKPKLFLFLYFFATLDLFAILDVFARTAILYLFARTFSPEIFIALPALFYSRYVS